MKKIITVGVFFTLFACVHLFGQNLVATCSSLEVTGLGSTAGIYVENFATKQTNQFCLKVLLFGSSSQRQYMLSKFDGSNYVTVSGWQLSSLFTNLSKGTYKVTIRTPTVLIQSGCSDGISLMNSAGQIVGKIGTWFNTVTASAVVGAPTLSDNQWNFIDGNGVILVSNLFDNAEPIRINANSTNSNNFDEYAISIQEFWPGSTPTNPLPALWRGFGNGGYGGFIKQATRPLGIEDLRAIWNINGTSPLAFNPSFTYRVQVVVRNSNCPSWVDNSGVDFLICPFAGCREGYDEAKSTPLIVPNPTSQKFRIEGFNFNTSTSVSDELIVNDVTGRVVKKFDIDSNDFDVSDFASGVYFASVLRDNRKLFTQKFVVSR